MKNKSGNKIEKHALHIPFRYILSMLIIIFEFLGVIAATSVVTIFVPYFYLVVLLTQICCAVAIINSKDNPDYKVPWLFIVLLVPIVGFMTYFMFYSRRLSDKQIKRIKSINSNMLKNDTDAALNCKKQDEEAFLQANSLKAMSQSHIYQNTDIKYFASGEELFESLLADLKTAKEFIFMDYFIIEEGLFWNSILQVLKQKVAEGVEVKVVYDDIGCMTKLKGDYYKTLQSFGIDAVIFNKLKGQANNEFNNRSHRKITSIDGKIAYTGGINLADEYINHVVKFGHWKDVGVRLDGEAVDEMTRLFLIDYSMSSKAQIDFEKYYRGYKKENSGFCVPFGDGPKPVYERRVAKTMLLNMLGNAKKYFYITTPYLIIDDELTSAIENAALKGVDVRIITPHIPDKKMVFMITQSSYEKLQKAGVKIYEYQPGFIHAKTYLCDDKYAVVGTINLDYRSLVHHFENGVWIYNHEVIGDIKKDFENTLEKSLQIKENGVKIGFFRRIFRPLINIFASLL